MKDFSKKFDFLSSDTYRTAKAQKFINLPFFKFLKIFLYIVAGLIILYILAVIYLSFNAQYFGWSLLVLALILVLAVIDIFINFHYQSITRAPLSPDTTVNLANYLEMSTAGAILYSAFSIIAQSENKSLSPIEIFLALAKNPLASQVLARSRLYFGDDLAKELREDYQNAHPNDNLSGTYAPSTLEVLDEAYELALARNAQLVDFGDLILALYKKDDFIKNYFDNGEINFFDLESIVNWYRRIRDYSEKKYYWQRDYFGPGIGQDWASGYTPVLNYFSRDISAYLAEVKLQAVVLGHREILSQMEESLAKSSNNNVALIGEVGVGKRTIVNALAQKIIRGQSLAELKYQHVVELDSGALLSGAKEGGELEQRFSAILRECEAAGNIILYINNFDNIVNPEIGKLGTIDASQFLIPFLQSARLKVIVTVNPDGWHKKIESNANLAGLFTKITVEEPKAEEMMPVLEDSILNIEYKNKVYFTYLALKKILELCQRFIHEEVFPQKAINLADSLATKLNSQKFTIIDTAEVEEFVTSRYKVPAGEASGEEKEKLISLDQELHQRIIDQEEAVSQVADALRRARSGLAKKNKPLGSFLFVGPTGVGKTETAKALAEIFFGSTKNLLRFDMSEFQEASSLNRLIGAESGKEQGLLSIAIRENPYSVFLFDELEKAHPNILNLFLQMLDEGAITDTTGRKLDFTNVLIIATSNAGAEEIREYLGSGKPLESMAAYIMDYLQKQGLFKPELLNRFDAVVCFKPLTEEHILAIAKLLLAKLQNTMLEKGITLNLTPEAIKKLAQLGYSPTLGARPMARVIQDKVENLLAKRLLKNEIKKGDTITLSDQDIA
ncbi:MAG: ATP-dependent Clp protease ATP-binding subunit [Patescibacteria group bacterium]|nr:ATP-dependent Clp protease ATP-binding subunit [Patescibacteria group bacterium]